MRRTLLIWLALAGAALAAFAFALATGSILLPPLELLHALASPGDSVAGEIVMQLRLPRRSGKRADILLGSTRFRAAYDFLLLREAAGALAGESPDAFAEQLGGWWSDYQDADFDQRQIMLRDLEAKRQPGDGAGRKRRRRRKT